jgi:competence protein ComEC
MDFDERRARGRAAVIGTRGAALGARAGERLSAGWAWVGGLVRAEAEAGRLAPWLPICFGSGVLVYFAAPAEPALVAALAALAVLAAIAWVSRERPAAFAVALGVAALAAGFAAATLRANYVAHPVLARPTATLTLKGFVESRDATERSERVVLRITGKEGRGAEKVPGRVRLAVRRGFAPAVGEHVELKARLRPLLGPVRPGGYDYALGAYFQRLGATGFVFGRPKATPAPTAVPLDIRFFAAIEGLRRAMDARIRAVLPGENGAVASALVTGVRDAIPFEVNEAMRISGLYHVLSISGLHMVLVVAVIFVLVRGGLALVPALSLRRPIKKWAALAALGAAAFYLVLSGSEVATQRSFIMAGLVLVGVLADRPAITLRTLAFAATATLAIQPEALLNPGFQMSFAATLAIVSIYQPLAPAMAQPPAPRAAMLERALRGGGRWVLLGALTSLVAGLATTPYAAFHFHRLAPYGLLANMLAMPVISFVIMPAAVISTLLMPFGYDALGWQVMGFGIEIMLRIARWVASIPGAEGRIAAFGVGAVLVATLGLIVLALPTTRLRLAGIPILLLALFLAVTATRPDIYIDAEGEAVAVRGADGRLAIYGAKRDRISAQSWLAADGEGRVRADVEAGFKCDDNGCVAKLADGTNVAVALRTEAFTDDCRDAGLVVSQRDIPAACAAAAIDRRTLSTTGAIGLRRVEGKWIAETARSPRADRPWYGRAQPADANALARLERKPPIKPVSDGEGPLAVPGDVPVPELLEDSGSRMQ